MHLDGAGLKDTGLHKFSVQMGWVTPERVEKIVQKAREEGIPFISLLAEEDGLSAQKIAVTLSAEFGIPFLDLNYIDRDALPKDIVSDDLIIKLKSFPIAKKGGRIYIATADPVDRDALKEFSFKTGERVSAVVVEIDKLLDVIELVYAAEGGVFEGLVDEDLDGLVVESIDNVADNDSGADGVDDTPIVKFVNKVLLDAIHKGASDIHFEPYEYKFRVRFRSDGILHEVTDIPIALAPKIAARIKVMSNLDIAEKRVPQDGRIKMKLSKTKAVDFRVSTCPVSYGEKVVLRILDPASAAIGIDALGFESDQRELFTSNIFKPYGMNLVTGPTGSGKTVTLYTALNMLNTVERNISTCEDPVEMQVTGVNQVDMNLKAGLTFAKALKSFLRQDPDIIMIGEIRDLETAEIGVKAAQTGHMVLSTLHTNDAPQTLNRMQQMGLDAFNIVSSTNMIIAQRLGRRLCSFCKTEVAGDRFEYLLQNGIARESLDLIERSGLVTDGSIYQHHEDGCDKCSGGYKGRVGLYQVMPVTDAIQRAVLSGSNANELSDIAFQEGVRDLRTSGVLKILHGITSLSEINRVTNE